MQLSSFLASIALLLCSFLATATPLSIRGDRPLSNDTSRFTLYTQPTPGAGPCDICTGSDNAIWISDFLVNKIARLDPATGHIDEYDIPFTNPPLNISGLGFGDVGGRGAFACAIRPGTDGNIYASSGLRNQLVKVDVKTKKVEVFTPKPYNPLGDLQPFNDMWTGDTGMWFTQTTASVISFFDYKTHEFSNYPIPNPFASPLGLIVASDKNVWFTELAASAMAKFDPRTKTFTTYPLPPTLSQPAVVRAESLEYDAKTKSYQKYLYFTSLTANALGRINIANGQITPFTTPFIGSFPAEDTIDSQGRVWFSSFTQNILGVFDTKTKVYDAVVPPYTLVATPVSVPPAVDVAVHWDNGTNSIWFAGVANQIIGRYQL